MRLIKKNTDTNVMVLMTSDSTHITGVADLTLAVSLSKNCGDFALITPTITSKGYGWYKIELTTSHTDTVGDLVLHITATGADPTDVIYSVAEYAFGEIGLMVNELHTIQGLNASSPSTTTQTLWSAGTIEIGITGDGTTTTTMTRQ